MRPVKGRIGETAMAGRGEAAAQGLVLPRILRRPVRAIQRIEWKVPHRFGLKAFLIFAIGTAGAGMWFGGHAMTVVSAITAKAGLAITEVKITGQSETSEVNVLERLAIGEYPSLLTFDVDKARARVELLPWVKTATLKKLFPNTLEVAIAERTPFALWQHAGEVSLIDDAGRVITDAVDARYANLPFVTGPGAGARAREFVDLVASVPGLAAKVRAGMLISGRRWTVVFNNGVEALLPIEQPAEALATVARLDAQDELLSREIAAVDLRLPGRMIVRLTDDGLAERKAMLKERDKLARRKRSNT